MFRNCQAFPGGQSPQMKTTANSTNLASYHRSPFPLISPFHTATAGNFLQTSLALIDCHVITTSLTTLLRAESTLQISKVGYNTTVQEKQNSSDLM